MTANSTGPGYDPGMQPVIIFLRETALTARKG